MTELTSTVISAGQSTNLAREDVLSDEAFAAVNTGDTATVVRRIERLRVMAQRVRSLHRPVEIEVYGDECSDGICEHESDECPLVTISVCNECDNPEEVDEFTRYHEYPCNTIEGLDRE